MPPALVVLGRGRQMVDEKKAEWGKKQDAHNHQGMESSGESVCKDSKRKLGPFPRLEEDWPVRSRKVTDRALQGRVEIQGARVVPDPVFS